MDQRQMSGLDELETADQVHAFWKRSAEQAGRTLRHSDRVADAFISDGRWVAKCPSDDCNGGIAAGPAFDEGACLSCFRIYELNHPAKSQIAAVEEIFQARPPERRHWRPWEQTVDELRTENTIHGFLSDVGVDAGEINRIAGMTGLTPTTVERVIRAQEKIA